MLNENQNRDLKKLDALKNGEHCYISISEESGGVVWKLYDQFFLFEVSDSDMVHFSITSRDKVEIINEASSWT